MRRGANGRARSAWACAVLHASGVGSGRAASVSGALGLTIATCCVLRNCEDGSTTDDEDRYTHIYICTTAGLRSAFFLTLASRYYCFQKAFSFAPSVERSSILTLSQGTRFRISHQRFQMHILRLRAAARRRAPLLLACGRYRYAICASPPAGRHTPRQSLSKRGVQ